MAGWITSIVGVICLGVLLEIVLPEGKTAKYVKGAFSLIVIIVIVAPLPSLFKKDWKFDLSENFSPDSGFVSATYADYGQSLEEELEKLLLENGCEAQIDIYIKDGLTFEIDFVELRAFGGEPTEAVALICRRLALTADKVKIIS